MSRKPSLPTIDENALEALARQFPATVVSIVKEPEAAPAPPPAAPPAAASSAPVEAQPPRRRGGRALATLALLVALIALGVAETAVMPEKARVWLRQHIDNPAIANAVTGNRSRLEATLAADATTIKALEARLATAESRLAAIEAVGGSSSAAASRIDALESDGRATTARVEANEDALRGATDQIGQLRETVTAQGNDVQAINDRIAGLNGDLKASETATNDAFSPRLATLEGGLAGATRDDRVTRFFLAAQELRRATESSRPFAHELETARGFAGDNADIAAAFKTMSAYAAVGVPTVGELRDDFSLVVAPSILALSGGKQKGAVGWVRSWFGGQTPTTPADRNAALVGQASHNLEKEQLGTAVEEVLLLEDQAALIAADWLRSASARLAVDKAVASVTAKGFDRLSDSGH